MRERLGLLPVEEEDGKKKDANAVHKALLQVTQCYSPLSWSPLAMSSIRSAFGTSASFCKHAF